MIKIEEVKINEFDAIYEELVELQYQNDCIHFPEKKIDKDKQTKPTVKSIKEYMLENKAFLFIAKKNDDKNKILGFLWCYPRKFFDENRIFINSLIIRKQYRGKHIGTILIEKAEEKAQQLGCDSIYVSSAAFNEKALKFYRTLKYEDEKIQLVKKIKKRKREWQ